MTMFKHQNRALPMMRRSIAAAGLALSLASIGSAALAQQGGVYAEQTGEEIYKGICQGCHMPDGKGATGAGTYPSLVGDKKFAAKAYPALIIIKGQKAMPSFSAFSDAQTAEVVNYIRSNFGNKFKDVLKPEEVKVLRPTRPAGGEVRPPG